MADTTAPARQAYSIELVANGDRGGAFVWVNGECAGRIGVPFWGMADDPDHRLYTASVPSTEVIGEVPVGNAAGMTREEARAAVVAAWCATEPTEPTEPAEPAEPAEVEPADHAEAARLAAVAAVEVAITSAVAAGVAPTRIQDMRRALGLL